MSIIYDSWLDKYKKPFGALNIHEKLKLSIVATTPIDEVCLVIETDDHILEEIKMERSSNDIFTIESYQFEEENIYFYYFKVLVNKDGNVETKYYGKKYDSGKCVQFYDLNCINKYQLTVSKEMKTPKWFKEGIVYHIFIDRFNKVGKMNNTKKNSFIYANWEDTPMYIKNSNNEVIRWDFHGGNLKGIISKLNYLKSLGVSTIYLSPIFEAQSNHKYDTGNYKKIDPMFGDEDIFKELIDKSHKKGISIILDGVFSHTGDDSIYFNKYNNYDSVGAYQSQNSIYSSWYKFENYPDKYDCWWGVKALPNTNEIEESYLKYMIYDDTSVIKKWMKLGVKGWRLDVADELPSKFIEELRKESLRINKDSILVGEVWEDASNKISYEQRRKYLLGSQLNGVTGYLFKNIVIDFLLGKLNSKEAYNKFMTVKENYPKEAFKSNLNLLGTHDTKRILTEFNEDKELLKLAVAIQMTSEGVPYIYYGDEAGVIGGVDPDNRRTYPWKNEDKEILSFYRSIIKVRNHNEVLVKGNTRFLEIENQDIFGYIRYIDDKKLSDMLILINRSESEQVIELDLKHLDNKYGNNKANLKAKSFEIINLIETS